MDTYIIYTAAAAAFAIGVGLGVLVMCLVAMGKLGDDPMPEVDVVTDADGKIRHVMATDSVNVRMRQYQD
ncbi:hypothetical protein HTY52_22790 [Cupriavidus taiwanensis]|uniref:hypothetical protein n=1 Tax=Cupriavidus taiwanensis TaxID=164546 RepID=UPI001573CEB8|nr:hypothetical protein [Cupriavidus taiwanensis]NSX16923.1 hypothetical protein [Cupriavidus taiwanensis]